MDFLKVIGDSEIITRHVRNIVYSLSPHIKNYQREVWKLIFEFKSFGIKLVQRINNATIDTLHNAATRFTPLRDEFSIEIVYKLVVSDNITIFLFSMKISRY